MKKNGRGNSSVLAKNFGERLHRYREDRGLSQRQLAQLAGIDAMQISRYERGQGLPTTDTLVAIAKALRLSLDTLVMGKADRMGEALPIRNVMLLERLADVDKLDKKDQEMILELIHSVLARRDMEAAALGRRRGS